MSHLTVERIRRTGKLSKLGWSSVHSFKVWDPTRLQIHEDDVLQASDLPDIGDLHPTDGVAVVTEINVEEISNGGGEEVFWQADVLYQHTGVKNPLEEDPIVRFGTVQYMRVAEKAWDINGSPPGFTENIQNAAGDPFDPPIQKVKSRVKINITKNYSFDFFSPNWLAEFTDSVNDRAIRLVGLDLEEWQARMLYMTADPGSWVDGLGDTQKYFRVNFIIEIDTAPEFTQAHSILNQGFNYLDEETPPERHVFEVTLGDDEGVTTPSKVPQKLDFDGTPLPTGDPADYLSFLTYEPKDWLTTLALPAELPTQDIAGVE